MPAFAITAVGGFPPPTADEFPQFIQWQSAGTNLGLPDVDTVNVSTNLTATRGTGENANTVTLTASGGGGGAGQTLVLRLAMAESSTPEMNGNLFYNWDATVLVSSTDAEWVAETSRLQINVSGTYEVTVALEIFRPDSSTFQNEAIQYGSFLLDLQVFSSTTGRSYVTNIVDFSPPNFNRATCTDLHMALAPSGGETYLLAAYSNTYNTSFVDYSADVIVRRLGDYTA